MDRPNKRGTFTQQTAVPVLCETTAQSHILQSYITYITLYATFQLLSYFNPNNDLFLNLTERFCCEM